MAIDPFSILASLGIHNASKATPVTGGADTLIWKVECEGKSYALRLFRADQKEPARREAAAMRAGAAAVPVPQIIQQGLWQDRPAVLLEWCDGEPLLTYLIKQPEALPQLGVEFGRLHAQINALPAPDDLTSSTNLVSRLEQLDPLLAERFLRLPPSAPKLLHLDFHPMNVLTDGKQITAVIDWVNALPGDARLDFARTLAIFRIAPIPDTVISANMRRAFERAWRQGYLEAAGIPSEMPLFYAIVGKAMIPEYTPRVANRDHDLKRLIRWTRYWRRCAGVQG